MSIIVSKSIVLYTKKYKPWKLYLGRPSNYVTRATTRANYRVLRIIRNKKNIINLAFFTQNIF